MDKNSPFEFYFRIELTEGRLFILLLQEISTLRVTDITLFFNSLRLIAEFHTLTTAATYVL